MHLRRSRSTLARGAAAAALLVAAAVVLPAAASASGRERAASAHDATPAKSATATCPAGQRVVGAGGRIVGDPGAVALTSIVPDPGLITVTATGRALHPSAGEWSVVAAAVCSGTQVPQRKVSPPGLPVAACPAGTRVSGTGFQLPGSGTTTLLTGLIPDTAAGTVTVGYAPVTALYLMPVSYAICVPDAEPTWAHRFAASAGAPDASSPKTATVQVEHYPVPLWGVGGQITGAATDVFIDTLLPADDLLTVRVRAARLLPAGPARARVVAGPDDWSVTGYGICAYYY